MMRGVKGLGDGITAELSCYFFGGDLNLLETLNKRFGCTREALRRRLIFGLRWEHGEAEAFF
jgi:hypothetical protein